MLLSPPADRVSLHTRQIEIRGYRRADGLFDIEGHLIDTKPYGFPNHDRGYIAADEPVHDLWLRMTVNEHMLIVTCEVLFAREPRPTSPCSPGSPFDPASCAEPPTGCAAYQGARICVRCSSRWQPRLSRRSIQREYGMR